MRVIIDKNLEYALGGISNKIFASKYITYLPNKDEIIKQVEAVIESQDKIKKIK